MVDTRQRDRETRTRLRAVNGGAVRLEAADADGLIVRHHAYDLVPANGAAPHGSRHDRPGAANREHAVDRHAEHIVIASGRHVDRRRGERLAELRRDRRR